MRKIFLLFALMILAISQLQAQLNSLQTDASAAFPNATDNTIVRNYHNNFAIGFIIDNNNSYFYSTNIEAFSSSSPVPPTSGTKVLLPPGTVINDMVVHGEYIFFCGQLTMSTTLSYGIYGWFRTDDLCFGPNVVINSYPISSPTVYLKKLVVIRSSSTDVNIVAIGEDNSSLQQNYIIEVFNLLSTVSHSYAVAPLPAISNTQKYELTGVHVVNNNIVFVGIDKLSSFETFFLKKASGPNVFADPSLSNTYLYHNTGGIPLLSGITPCSEAVRGHAVAVAHQYYRNGPNTAVSIIDITSNMNCITAHVLSNVNRSDLREMRYIPGTDNLVLLYGDIGNPLSFFLSLNPMTTSPYSTYLLPSSHKYTSLDLLNTTSFLSSGNNYWYMQRIAPSGLLNPCLSPTEVQITQTGYYLVVETIPLTPVTRAIYSPPGTPSVNSIPVSVICIQ